MSGGPSVTGDGAVAGVNVSKRRDGEWSASWCRSATRRNCSRRSPRSRSPQGFQSPDRPAAAGAPESDDRPPARQPLTSRAWGPTRCRCASRAGALLGTLQRQGRGRSRPIPCCAMESAIYVSDIAADRPRIDDATSTCAPARLDIRALLGPGQHPVQGRQSGQQQGHAPDRAHLHRIVRAHQNLPLRAVNCVRAYRKFAGLYNFTLLTATTDDGKASLQSRLDVAGVSYENGMRTTRAFLEALGAETSRKHEMNGPWFIEMLARNGDVLHRHRSPRCRSASGAATTTTSSSTTRTRGPHALIEAREDGELVLRDLGTKNGIIHRGPLSEPGHDAATPRFVSATPHARARRRFPGRARTAGPYHAWLGRLAPGLVGILMIAFSRCSRSGCPTPNRSS
jgi:hypothetical protein